MEGKGALRCTKRISNANIFEAEVSRDAAQNRLIDDLLSLFGGRSKPVMARLVENGDLTLEDIKEASRHSGSFQRMEVPNDFRILIASGKPSVAIDFVCDRCGLLTLALKKNRAAIDTRYGWRLR